MRSPTWLVPAVVSSFLLAGCGDGSSTAHLTVKADVSVCRSEAACQVLHAGGARVQVVSPGGDVVLNDVLTRDGTLAADISPGDYTVKASFLNFGSTHTDVTLGKDEDVLVSLNLPRLLASK